MIILKGLNRHLYEIEIAQNKVTITVKIPISAVHVPLFPVGDNYGVRVFPNKKGKITRRAWYRKEFPAQYYSEYWALNEASMMLAELTRTVARIKPLTNSDPYITVR